MAERPLRILQVLRSPIGGLYRHVADLTGELISHGHAVGLVMDNKLFDAQTEERIAPFKDKLQLGIHRMPMPRIFGSHDLVTPFRLRALARKLGVDILHGHGAKGGYHARLARRGDKHMKALYTPHGGVLHYDAASAVGKVLWKIEAFLSPATEAMIFESLYARSVYLQRMGEISCPTPVVYNGLKKTEFEPVIETPDAADFCFVGELRELKGIYVLLEAMQGLRRPDGRPVRLVMAGDGPAREEFATAIRAAGLETQIELIGVTAAREAFAKGRCVVIPSLAESLPYVVLEAVAASRPLITTDVGGVPEIFGSTSTSLIPAGEPNALRHAMQNFLNAPGQMDRATRTRFGQALKTFSLERMGSDIEALYRELQPQVNP